MAETFNISNGIEAQKMFCEENGHEIYVPEDGVCHNCNRNIFQKFYWKGNDNKKTSVDSQEEADFSTGISVEEARTQIITGCPHCYTSFLNQ